MLVCGTAPACAYLPLSSNHTPTHPTLPAATSRFRRDRIGDAELARLLRWWQHTERSAADVNGDGLVDADEAALRVGGGGSCCTTMPGRRTLSAGGLPTPLHPICALPLLDQDKARPKLLRVQGRAVTEGDLRAILQVSGGPGLGWRALA